MEKMNKSRSNDALNKSISNALSNLNVKQLDEILREYDVPGRSLVRRKGDKIVKILKEIKEVATINEYLIRYGKQPIRIEVEAPTNRSTWEPEREIIAKTAPEPMTEPVAKPLSERQKKRESNVRNKLTKESNRLRKEIDKLKLEKEGILDKVKKLKKSHRGFKGKRIRKLDRESKNIGIQIEQLTKRLKEIESNPKFQKSIEISQKSKENKRIKKKMEELNRKIRRAKGKSKRNLMLKREALKLQLLDTSPKLIEGAFGGNYSKYRIEGIKGMDVPTFFSKIKASIGNVLRKETSQRAIRVQTTTWLRFEKEDEYVDKAFNSRMTPVYMLSDIDSIVQGMINHMAQQVDNPKLRDSKFVFDSILCTDINIHRLNLTRGSSYISLPDWLEKKKAIINPKNKDNECFKWAVIAGLKWEEIDCHPERISKLRRYEDEFDWSGIMYPASIKDINRFEMINGIGVNVLALEGRNPYICRKGGDYDRTVNLLLIEGEEEDKYKKHYTTVKSLSRLLTSMNTKHTGKQHYCTNCLQSCSTEEIRDDHYEYCRNNESVSIVMPTKNPIVEFTDGQRQFKVPFVMYADFESILEPIQGASI